MSLRRAALLLPLAAALAAGQEPPPAAGSAPGAAARGVSLYRKGDYGGARAAFQEAWRGGLRDGRLEYALGNCEWRLGAPARALVRYERARAWLPRDREAAANAALCRKALGLPLEAQAPLSRHLGLLVQAFTLGELVALAAGSSALLFLALGLRLIRRRRLLLWLGLAGGAGLALFGGQALARALARGEAALVVAAEAPLRAEPREGLEPLATLRAGVEVALAGREGRWARVEVGGRRGWLPAGSLGFLDWEEEAFAE